MMIYDIMTMARKVNDTVQGDLMDGMEMREKDRLWRMLVV